MRSPSLLLGSLILLIGIVSFEAGRRMGTRTVTSAHPPASIQAPAPVQPSAPAHASSCDKDLAAAKSKLGICLAYRAPGETEIPPSLQALMEVGKAEVIVRLDKPITSEMIEPTDSIVVRRPDGTVHAYGPSEWPPPGGPGVGSKILRRRRTNGETEVSPLDAFPEPEGTVSMPGETKNESLGRLIRETPGAIVVRHADGSLNVYAPGEWPPPGGLEPRAIVLGHRRGDGEMVWTRPNNDSK